MYKAFLLLTALAVLVPTGAQAVTTQDVVNQISQTSIQNYLTSLSTYLGNNRGFDVSRSGGVVIHGAHHDIARDVIFTGFRRSGWTTRYDPFSYVDTSGYTWAGENVVSVKQGVTNPDKIYVVGAHYDSKNNPGANDNASGVAGLLEMARVFAAYRFDSTIVFIAFDAEEVTCTTSTVTWRRIGGMHYASEHSTDNIASMISLDMVAHADGTSRGRLETGYSQNTTLNSQIISALSTYGGLGSISNNSMNYSDHVSFANYGFPALMLIESGWSTSDPYYHTQQDAVDQSGNISWPYTTSMIKTTAGWLCDQAGLNPGSGSAMPSQVPYRAAFLKGEAR